MQAQISFDLVMQDEMSFVEGTFRLSDGEWRVFTFIPDRSILKPRIDADARWRGGARGMVVWWPRGQTLKKGVVLQILSKNLGITEWEEVHGPDSMQLR